MREWNENKKNNALVMCMRCTLVAFLCHQDYQYKMYSRLLSTTGVNRKAGADLRNSKTTAKRTCLKHLKIKTTTILKDTYLNRESRGGGGGGGEEGKGAGEGRRLPQLSRSLKVSQPAPYGCAMRSGSQMP